MQKISKNDWKGWLNLCEFIKAEVLKCSKSQELTKGMVINIKGLLLCICSYTEEKITYSELLMLFKQCQPDIERVIVEENILTDDKKISIACQVVKQYFFEIFGDKPDEQIVPYFDKPCSTIIPCSFQIHKEVYQEFTAKANVLKEKMNKGEGKGKWRTFTIIGLINTCIMAFSKGLIDFRNDNGKVYMYCQSGYVGKEDECRLSE